MLSIFVAEEVSQALISSSKDAAAVLQPEELQYEDPQSKYDMSVTPDVSHVEMWPYAASAAALSESQRATAVLMLSLSSALPATAGTKLATHRSAAGPIVVLALGRIGQRLKSRERPVRVRQAPPAVRNVLREEEASEGARAPPARTYY